MLRTTKTLLCRILMKICYKVAREHLEDCWFILASVSVCAWPAQRPGMTCLIFWMPSWDFSSTSRRPVPCDLEVTLFAEDVSVHNQWWHSWRLNDLKEACWSFNPTHRWLRFWLGWKKSFILKKTKDGSPYVRFSPCLPPFSFASVVQQRV